MAAGSRSFVTGGTGFVGSHLVRHLVESGDAVATLIRPASDTWRIADVIDRVTPIRGRLAEPESLSAQLREFRPDVVYHLGWSGSGPGQRDAMGQAASSVDDAVASVELSAQAGAKVWVGLGSQAEFGPSDQVLDESTPTRPVTPYGAAKLAAGDLTRERCRQLSIRHVWLRLLTAYGPADHPTYLIPHVIISLLRGRRPPLTRGDQLGDFLQVRDACAAMRSAALTELCSGTFVLASGRPRAVRDVALAIRDIIDPRLEVGLGEISPAARPADLRGDPRALEQATGWRPRIELEEGLAECVDWYRHNLPRYLMEDAS